MKKRALLICFDVPYPDDYGGVRDVWSRIQYLGEADYEIDLLISCDDEQRIRAFRAKIAAERRCSAAVILRWSFDWRLFLGRLVPLSMAMRGMGEIDENRLAPLMRDSYDFVLVEHLKSLGLFLALRPRLKMRAALLRSHNIESEFYRRLAASERLGVKWLLLRVESLLYRWIEKRMSTSNLFDKVLYISKADMQRDLSFEAAQRIWLPMWMKGVPTVDSPTFDARTTQFLYVGNLDSSDNAASVRRLCRTLEPLLRDGMSFVVAGKRTPGVQIPLPQMEGVQYRLNLSPEELKKTYDSARVFLSYSLNEAGVKIKLIDALMQSLPVVVNHAGVRGSGFEDALYQLDAPNQGPEDLAFLRELAASRATWEEYLHRQNQCVAAFVGYVSESYQRAFAA